MRIIAIYPFSELSEKAKEKAIENLWDENHGWLEHMFPEDKKRLERRAREYEFTEDGDIITFNDHQKED
jgi:hypothetical protein